MPSFVEVFIDCSGEAGMNLVLLAKKNLWKS